MGRPQITKDTIKAQTQKYMTSMGTYKQEYDPIIDVYAGMREQYERLIREYTSSDGKSFRYSVPTSDGGEKKSPLSLTIESLRKDILQYSDRLMLNPKAKADSGNAKGKKLSRLAEALKDAP